MFQAGTGKQALSAELESWIDGVQPDRRGDIPILGNQGTFLFCVDSPARSATGETGFGFGLSGKAQPRLAKVFWFFFSTKNCFLPYDDLTH
jgi:hypothetical protein